MFSICSHNIYLLLMDISRVVFPVSNLWCTVLEGSQKVSSAGVQTICLRPQQLQNIIQSTIFQGNFSNQGNFSHSNVPKFKLILRTFGPQGSSFRAFSINAYSNGYTSSQQTNFENKNQFLQMKRTLKFIKKRHHRVARW